MPLDIAAGVVGFVAFGITVTQGLIKYYESYRNQTSEIEHATKKLLHFLRFIQALDRQLEARRPRDNDFDVPGLVQECIEDCIPTLESLEDSLKKLSNVSSQGTTPDWRDKARRYAYPFRKKDLRRLEEDLEEMTEQLQRAMQLLQGQDLTNTRDSIDDIKALLELVRADQVEEKVRQWLKAPDSSADYYSNAAKRHPDTGLWLVDSANFKNWLQSPGTFRWIVGFAGSGKSVLCSSAIDTTYKFCKSRDKFGIAFFFFTNNDKGKQDSSALLRALVLQLSAQAPRVELSVEHSSPQESTLLEKLVKLAEAFDSIYVFIDALDESPYRDFEDHRSAVLEIVKKMREKVANLHLLVTSRGYSDIREELSPRGKWAPEQIRVKNANVEEAIEAEEEEITMGSAAIDADIARFVTHQLEHDKKFRDWSSHKDRIASALSARSNGMFRLAECHLSELKRCPKSAAALEKALISLPKTLYGTYEKMLDNIPRHSRDYAEQILQILCAAIRPLRTDELVDALAMRMDSVPRYDHDYKIEPSESLVEICPGLIELGPPPQGAWKIFKRGYSVFEEEEQEVSTVSLSHFSVFEFLSQTERFKENDKTGFCFDIKAAHTHMSSLCLAYLLNAPLESSSLRGSFKMYAALAWPTHYHDGYHSPASESFVYELFFEHEEAFAMWSSIVENSPVFPINQGWLQRVYLSSQFDLTTILRTLLGEDSQDSASTNQALSSILQKTQPLFKLAAKFINFDATFGRNYENPLIVACLLGNKACVEILMSHKASMSIPGPTSGTYSLTPLMISVEQGYFEIARYLIDLGADLDAQNSRGHTALHRITMARGGELRIAQSLIATGADVDVKDENEETPLMNAARLGRSDMVELLVAVGGAQLEARNRRGKDALSIAAVYGHEDTVSCLVRHGASTLQEALDCTCKSTRLAVAQLLVSYLRDKESPIAASALENVMFPSGDDGLWRRATIQLLLDCGIALYEGALSDCVQGNFGKELLLQLIQRGASLDGMNSEGKTPLQATVAVKWRQEATTRLLLGFGATLDSRGRGGRTALHEVASTSCGVELTMILLQAGATVDIKDDLGKTPLQCACFSSGDMFDQVQILIDYGADIHVGEDDSPLRAAVRSGNLEIIRLLIQMGAVVSGKAGKDHSTVLHVLSFTPLDDLEPNTYAAEKMIEIGQLLLSSGADINARLNTAEQQTPLQVAFSAGNLMLARFFLKSGAQIETFGVLKAWMSGSYRQILEHVKLLHAEFEAEVEKDILLGVTTIHAIEGFSMECFYRKILDLCYQALQSSPGGQVKGGFPLIALQMAARRDDIGTLRSLLEKGANACEKGGPWGTPLIAGCKGTPGAETIRLLVEKGVDVNFCHDVHGTAFHAFFNKSKSSQRTGGSLSLGSRPSKLEVTKLLLEHTASIDGNPTIPICHLEGALTDQDHPLVEVLLKMGVPVTLGAITTAFRQRIKVCEWVDKENYWKIQPMLLKALMRQSKESHKAILRETIEQSQENWTKFFEVLFEMEDPIGMIDFLFVSLKGLSL